MGINPHLRAGRSQTAAATTGRRNAGCGGTVVLQANTEPQPANRRISPHQRQHRDTHNQQRQAILLADLHGYHYEEIATITGSNVGTVKSRIARARVGLLQLMPR